MNMIAATSTNNDPLTCTAPAPLFFVVEVPEGGTTVVLVLVTGTMVVDVEAGVGISVTRSEKEVEVFLPIAPPGTPVDDEPVESEIADDEVDVTLELLKEAVVAGEFVEMLDGALEFELPPTAKLHVPQPSVTLPDP